MIRVETAPGLPALRPARAPAQPGFAPLLHADSGPAAPDEPPAAAPAAPGTQATATLTATELAQLQAAESATGASAIASAAARDREGRRHADRMLTALGDLQRAVLLGADTQAARASLAAMAACMPHAADPALAAVLRALQVRAAIEGIRQQVATV